MAEQLIELNKNIGGGAGGYLEDLKDVNITNISNGDIISYDSTNQEYINQPKSLYPQSVELTYAEYKDLEDNNLLDPTTEYFITDIDVAEAYYVETAGQTASTGATTLTFTNSHITPTSDIRILAEPDSCKVSTNPQYKVKAKISSCGDGTATITFPALAENTTFWLLIECPLAVTVDPAYVYNTDETVIGQWIDGKPIYRKVFSGTYTNNDTLLTGVDTLVNAYGTILLDSWRAIPYSEWFNNSTYLATVTMSTTGTVIINIISGGVAQTTSCNIILEYTKS